MPPRKHSKKRDAIYECVRSTKTHPSAEWVYSRLKPEIPDLSLGTVYRNLNLFQQEGRLISVGVVTGLERFDACTTPHAHFICTHCGAVIDVDGTDPPEHLISQVHCGAVRECVLTFTGICNSCIRPDAANNEQKN